MILRIIRWMLALALVVLAVKWTLKGMQMGSVGAFYVIPALFLIIAVGFLVLRDRGMRLASMVGDFFAGFTFPNSKSSKPGLSYTLARFYRKQQRIEEAIAEYKKIISYYPNEKDAYLEMLGLAMESHDVKTYRQYARKYRRRFHRELEIVYTRKEPARQFHRPGWIKPYRG